MRFEKTSKANQRGFSLIELLLTASLIPIVFFAVFANMSSGIRTWKMLNQEVPEEELQVFFHLADRDFINILKYSGIWFLGDDQSVTFATTVAPPDSLGGNRSIGEVSYRFDPDKRVILREEKNISQKHTGSSSKTKVLLSGVSNFSIEYYSKDAQENVYSWKPFWKPTANPIAPAVRFHFTHQGTARSVTKTFIIAVGG